MAISPFKSFAPLEVLTAADLNASFLQITNAGVALVSPLSADFDVNGFSLILDADADSSIRSTTDDVVTIKLQNVDLFVFDGDVASPVNGFTYVASTAAADPEIAATGSDTNINVRLTPKGSGVVSSAGGYAVDGATARTWRITGSGTSMVIQENTGTAGSPTWTTRNTLATGVGLPSSSVASTPGGRLTLSTGIPVMTSTTTGATTVYYTPHVNDEIELYDGSAWVRTTFTERSQATTDNTKSPAAAANNSNYDMFVWSDSGTIRCTRGPAWSSDTARGTGAGTTQLAYQNGRLVNAVNITNGPAAGRGRYVGSIRTNGSAQVDFHFGAVGAGATAASFGVWNCFNRARCSTFLGDTADSWTYNSTTVRAANANNNLRCSFVRGLNEDAMLFDYCAIVNNAAGTNGFTGVGLDSTSAFAAGSAFGPFGGGSGFVSLQRAGYDALPGLGFHFLQALESSLGGTTTFVGDNGGTTQSGCRASLML